MVGERMHPMKLILCACLMLTPASCAYWHWWRGDDVEQRAVDDVNRSYARH